MEPENTKWCLTLLHFARSECNRVKASLPQSDQSLLPCREPKQSSHI